MLIKSAMLREAIGEQDATKKDQMELAAKNAERWTTHLQGMDQNI